jgi:hypothetical protein
MGAKNVPLFSEARIFGRVEMDADAICSMTIHAFFFMVVCKTTTQVTGLPDIEVCMGAAAV